MILETDADDGHMKITEKRLNGSGGIDLYYAEWRVETPRALVFVVHGLADHIGRHQTLIKRLVADNFGVVAIDLRGHGKSGGTRAFVDAFDLYVSDVTLAMVRVRQLYPRTPVVVFGHSMGAVIAALYELMVKPEVAGLILSSGAFLLPTPQFLQKASGLVGTIAPRIPTLPIDTRQLSRDPNVVASADADPLYFSGRVPARTGAELIAAGKLAREHASEIRSPLLVFHGTADTVTMPAGSELIYETAGSTDKTLHLFSGLYHETFNEPEREEVFELILGWLVERFPKT